METYKNDYSKEEDEALWELHEVRRRLHEDFKGKTAEQINNDAEKKFLAWKTGLKEDHEIHQAS